MREILFRGKRIDNGKWVQGSLFTRVNTAYIFPLPITTSKAEVDPETVGQFTGITANGTKIFEGDIIEWDELEWGEKHRELVEWNYNLFAIRKDDWGEWCEVIGNIHDNPELLEVE